MADDADLTLNRKRIAVTKNGPYSVEGGIPLIRKTQLVSEYGEPLTWKHEGKIDALEDWYCLCRCGQTTCPPFCDGTHQKIGFEGTETADTSTTESRAMEFPGSTRIIVKKDLSLCTVAGFCGLRDTSIAELITESNDTRTRSLVIAMVEHCPSGALTYRMEPDKPDIEPDFPQQIAMTIEITSEGPIAGSLWVTGGILVERSDGQPFETRNRVTLCNCGHSCNKPLCDGTHRDLAYRDARRRWVTRK